MSEENQQDEPIEEIVQRVASDVLADTNADDDALARKMEEGISNEAGASEVMASVSPEGVEVLVTLDGVSSEFTLSRGEESSDEGETTASEKGIPQDEDPDFSVVDSVEPVVEEEESLPETEVQKEVPEEDDGLSTTMKLIKARIDAYVKEMKPTLPKQAGECARYQLTLYRAMRSIIALKGRDFTTGMDLLVSYFKEHRNTVFAERYVARDFQNVSLPQADRLTFERLLRLFSVAADVNSRAEVSKHVDIGLVIRDFKKTEEQQRVLEYFKVG